MSHSHLQFPPLFLLHTVCPSLECIPCRDQDVHNGLTFKLKVRELHGNELVIQYTTLVPNCSTQMYVILLIYVIVNLMFIGSI